MKPLTVIVQLIDVATSCLTDIHHQSRRQEADHSEVLPVNSQMLMGHAIKALLQISTIECFKYVWIRKYPSSYHDYT